MSIVMKMSEVEKSNREKLVVYPHLYNHCSYVRVGRQFLADDRSYRWKKGGFNLTPAAARALSEALTIAADGADLLEEQQGLEDGGRDE